MHRVVLVLVLLALAVSACGSVNQQVVSSKDTTASRKFRLECHGQYCGIFIPSRAIHPPTEEELEAVKPAPDCSADIRCFWQWDERAEWCYGGFICPSLKDKPDGGWDATDDQLFD